VNSFEFEPRPRLVFGTGALERLGDLARMEGFRRTLLVADAGLMATPHVDRALGTLRASGIEVTTFSDFSENPDSLMIERGRPSRRVRASTRSSALEAEAPWTPPRG
jgi:alcohol dehydrogenase